LRAHGFTYRDIESHIGVKPKAAQFRVNAYHRRAGIAMPPGRPSGKMNAGLLGNRDRTI
jgi:hypothetical protein